MASVSQDPFPIVVLISGRGSNLEALIKRFSLPGSAVRIAAVISDSSSARGLEIARAAQIPTEIVRRQAKKIDISEYNNSLADTVASYSPKLVVLAGFMRIVTEEFLNRFPKRVMNIHPSLLPSFRGLHAQRQALAAGVKIAGCTVHSVIAAVDAGPIIAQAAVPVFPDDSEESLSARILAAEHELLPQVVEDIALRRIILDGDTDTITTEPSRLPARDARIFSLITKE